MREQFLFPHLDLSSCFFNLSHVQPFLGLDGLVLTFQGTTLHGEPASGLGISPLVTHTCCLPTLTLTHGLAPLFTQVLIVLATELATISLALTPSSLVPS